MGNFIINSDITLWNWEVLPTGGKLHRVFIQGVNYQGLKTARLRGVTLEAGDNVSVVIPANAFMSKPYMPYAEWLKLTDKSTHWTFSDHTYITQGNRETTAMTTAALEKELRPVKVTAFDWRSLPGLESWKLVCK